MVGRSGSDFPRDSQLITTERHRSPTIDTDRNIMVARDGVCCGFVMNTTRDVSGQKLCKGQEATETREIELLGTKGGVLWGEGG